MNDASASLNQLNRTLIGSVLFIDIVDYSARTVPDQIAMKEAFIDLLVDAIQNVAPADRIMVDTGDGAGIAFLGDPEDALFTALTLRDAITAGKVKVGEPGFVRMGINLGPLKVVRDINGHTNMIGDAVNDAERVMSFSEPGQVMVSHSYYDIISRFSRDYNQLFVHEGTKHDKHVREHEIYRFGPVAGTEDLAEKLRDRSRARHGNGALDPAADELPVPTKAAFKVPRRRVSRIRVAAGLVGVIVMTGALWSWTRPSISGAGAPEPAVNAGADVPPASAAGNAPAMSSLVPSAASSGTSIAAPAVAMPVPAVAGSDSRLSNPVESKPAEAPLVPKHAEGAAAPAKPGIVKLVIQPWGEIYVDGIKRGVSPPLGMLNLSPGKHKVEIRNGQFAPQKQVIDVKSGAETTMEYTF